MTTDEPFKKGDRVRLTRCINVQYRGKVGTVLRVVKRRGVVTVKMDDAHLPWYDAYPVNVDRETSP